MTSKLMHLFKELDEEVMHIVVHDVQNNFFREKMLDTIEHIRDNLVQFIGWEELDRKLNHHD